MVRRAVLIVAGVWAMGATFFQVNWLDRTKHAVSIRAIGAEQEVYDCLESGREAKVRFEMRLCKRRGSWFDSCADTRTEFRSISFDSITESYRVESDRLGDDLDPVAVGIPSRENAVRATITAENVPLQLLAGDEGEILLHPRSYLQTRALFICKGSVNRTLAQLSQILTFGLVNVIESDSGWVDFFIRPSEIEVRQDTSER